MNPYMNKIVPFTEDHGIEVCTWIYPPPYETYNWPSWQAMLQHEFEFADPDIRRDQYAAIVDQDGKLSGFAQFFPLAGVTRLGLSLRPELCGQGHGAQFMGIIVQEAKRRAPGQEIDLEVLVSNERAIRTYERKGFVITDTYEKMTPEGWDAFHCMVYQDQES
ncbi:GNAT family N-acetyltransferase [Paenibacillus hexagrammi]|uniref:GNAT family N-acetyltransferase n=1 Tax=Paenibacillus hexagrammi TaxID=2908839 RepID=A0ABY3SK28_9BACL|nr:GNAT family N-acetyltransferase [Paenibacillus sp. YPD9-1]UJF33594.1 GNAT family N-acetyltransferase [Paenibacillus sp. YPD9-1]